MTPAHAAAGAILFTPLAVTAAVATYVNTVDGRAAETAIGFAAYTFSMLVAVYCIAWLIGIIQ